MVSKQISLCEGRTETDKVGQSHVAKGLKVAKKALDLFSADGDTYFKQRSTHWEADSGGSCRVGSEQGWECRGWKTGRPVRRMDPRSRSLAPKSRGG